jgi:hypothetical protein
VSVQTVGIIIIAFDAVIVAWLIFDGIRLGRRGRIVPPYRPAGKVDPSAGSRRSAGAGRPAPTSRRVRGGAANHRSEPPGQDAA